MGAGTKSADVNTSKSMGSYGNYVVSATTKVFDKKIGVSTIQVVSGTATVTGVQMVENKRGEDWYPSWSGVILAQGTYIVNLTEVTIVASDVTIVHYSGE
jgi:hypothetical protein